MKRPEQLAAYDYSNATTEHIDNFRTLATSQESLTRASGLSSFNTPPPVLIIDLIDRPRLRATSELAIAGWDDDEAHPLAPGVWELQVDTPGEVSLKIALGGVIVGLRYRDDRFA